MTVEQLTAEIIPRGRGAPLASLRIEERDSCDALLPLLTENALPFSQGPCRTRSRQSCCSGSAALLSRSHEVASPSC